MSSRAVLLTVISLTIFFLPGCAFLDQILLDVSQGAVLPEVQEKGAQVGAVANLVAPGAAAAVGGAATIFLAWLAGRKIED